MSVNCIKCDTHRRTGADLLCDVCRTLDGLRQECAVRKEANDILRNQIAKLQERIEQIQADFRAFNEARNAMALAVINRKDHVGIAMDADEQAVKWRQARRDARDAWCRSMGIPASDVLIF